MAIPFEVKIAIRDQANKVGTVGFFTQNGGTLVQYNELGEQLADVVDNITDGVVESASLGVTADVSALTNNTALDGSDVGDVGQFQFRDEENRTVRINVPAIIESLAGAGSDDLNQANAAVAAFITGMEDGIATVGGTILPCNIGENDVVSVEFARIRHRNRGVR